MVLGISSSLQWSDNAHSAIARERNIRMGVVEHHSVKYLVYNVKKQNKINAEYIKNSTSL